MSYWITDRPPTEADGDKDGDVWVRVRPDREIGLHMHWSIVGIGTPWQRSHFWRPPAPQPEPEPEPEEVVAELSPRRFVSINRTILKDGDHILDAIDDEGIAWWMRLDTHPHHPAFPPRDPEWQQLSPLPARELPTEPEF